MLLAKVLNLFILSQCNFCSLIGMSCNKMLQNKMKQIQKPVLLIVYSDPQFKSRRICWTRQKTNSPYKNILTLTEVCKTIRGENPFFINGIFTQKKINDQLRRKNTLNFAKVTFTFRVSQLWNQFEDSIRSAPSAKHFQTEMLKNWQVIKCAYEVNTNKVKSANCQPENVDSKRVTVTFSTKVD